MALISINNSNILAVFGILICLQLRNSAPNSRLLQAPYSRILKDDTHFVLAGTGRRLHSKSSSNIESFRQLDKDNSTEYGRNLQEAVDIDDNETAGYLDSVGVHVKNVRSRRR